MTRPSVSINLKTVNLRLKEEGRQQIRTLRQSKKDNHLSITEIEVLTCIAQGMSYVEMTKNEKARSIGAAKTAVNQARRKIEILDTSWIIPRYDPNTHIKVTLKALQMGLIKVAEEVLCLDIHLQRIAEDINKGLININTIVSAIKELPSLSPRERQVLQLIVRGFSNQGIIDKLKLSERTLQDHLSNMLRKLKRDNRTGAVLLVLEKAQIWPASGANSILSVLERGRGESASPKGGGGQRGKRGLSGDGAQQDSPEEGRNISGEFSLGGNGEDFVLGRPMREQYYNPPPERDLFTGRRMRGVNGDTGTPKIELYSNPTKYPKGVEIEDEGNRYQVIRVHTDSPHGLWLTLKDVFNKRPPAKRALIRVEVDTLAQSKDFERFGFSPVEDIRKTEFAFKELVKNHINNNQLVNVTAVDKFDWDKKRWVAQKQIKLEFRGPIHFRGRFYQSVIIILERYPSEYGVLSRVLKSGMNAAGLSKQEQQSARDSLSALVQANTISGIHTILRIGNSSNIGEIVQNVFPAKKVCKLDKLKRIWTHWIMREEEYTRIQEEKSQAESRGSRDFQEERKESKGRKERKESSRKRSEDDAVNNRRLLNLKRYFQQRMREIEAHRANKIIRAQMDLLSLLLVYDLGPIEFSKRAETKSFKRLMGELNELCEILKSKRQDSYSIVDFRNEFLKFDSLRKDIRPAMLRMIVNLKRLEIESPFEIRTIAKASGALYYLVILYVLLESTHRSVFSYAFRAGVFQDEEDINQIYPERERDEGLTLQVTIKVRDEILRKYDEPEIKSKMLKAIKALRENLFEIRMQYGEFPLLSATFGIMYDEMSVELSMIERKIMDRGISFDIAWRLHQFFNLLTSLIQAENDFLKSEKRGKTKPDIIPQYKNIIELTDEISQLIGWEIDVLKYFALSPEVVKEINSEIGQKEPDIGGVSKGKTLGQGSIAKDSASPDEPRQSGRGAPPKRMKGSPQEIKASPIATPIAILFRHAQEFREYILRCKIPFLEQVHYEGSELYIHPTKYCPTNCDFCSFSSPPPPSGDITGDKNILSNEAIIKSLRFIKDGGFKKLAISGGGEPFSEIGKVIALIRNADVEIIEVVTSGNWAYDLENTRNIIDKLQQALSNRDKPVEFRLRVSVDWWHQRKIPIKNVMSIINIISEGFPNTNYPGIHLLLRTIYLTTDKTVDNIAESLDAELSPWEIGTRRRKIKLRNGFEVPIAYSNLKLPGVNLNGVLKGGDYLKAEDILGPLRNEDGDVILGLCYNDLSSKGLIPEVGLNMTIDFDGSIFIFGGSSPDNKPSIYRDDFKDSLNILLNDVITRALLKRGIFYVKDIAKEVKPNIDSAISQINDPPAYIRESLKTPKLRLFVTIRLLQEYVKEGKVDIDKLDPVIQRLIAIEKESIKQGYEQGNTPSGIPHPKGSVGKSPTARDGGGERGERGLYGKGVRNPRTTVERRLCEEMGGNYIDYLAVADDNTMRWFGGDLVGAEICATSRRMRGFSDARNFRKRLEKDSTSWLGRTGFTERDLLNLGLKEGSLWKNEWRLDDVLPGFSNCSPEARRRLSNKFKNPRRNYSEVSEAQEIMRSFLEGLGPKEGEQAIDKIKRIMVVIREFSASKDAYYEELKILKDKHYYDDYHQRIEEHNKPYPDVTECLILLGRMIIILQEINNLLPESQLPVMQSWKRKLAEILQRKEIRAFLGRENFLSIIASWLNPYLFAPQEYISEDIPQEFAEDIAKIDSREETFERTRERWGLGLAGPRGIARFIASVTRKKAVGLAGQRRADPRFEAARVEFAQLVEEFGDLWEIGPRVKEGIAKHPFLRQFPDGKMDSPLADIDCYCRVALMMLEKGYKLPNSNQPAGTIRLASYRNSLLSPKATTNISPIRISLGGSNSALLLSGPNMAGKTTTARGIGLAVWLTQIGFPLPDDNPELAVFRNIYTVFPRPEQLQAGYGYFAMLIKELTDLIRKAGSGDLVILDEVPTGTDYNELVAIATVLIEDLINTGATVIVTGHIKKAFKLIAQRTGQQPYMHTVTEKEGRLVPDFGLACGIAEHSHAIELMSQAGFEDKIVQLARAYYAVITGRRDTSSIPVVKSIKKRRIAATKVEDKVSDAELIKAVVEKVYPEGNFAFLGTQEQIISVLTRSEYPQYVDDSSIFEIERNAEKGVPVIKERKQASPLHYTEIFVAQGQNYLSALTAMLAIFREMSTRRLLWRPVEYSPQEIMERMERLELALKQLISHLEALKEEEEIGEMLKFFEKVINEELPELRKKYSQDIQQLDAEALDKLQKGWSVEWAGFLRRIVSRAKFFDYYTGIARGVIKWGLKAPRFSEKPNTFSLKRSRPLFANRGFWASDSPFVENAVEQSFEINPHKPAMALTGPNSSGKTVMMFNSRMNALFALHNFYVSGDLEMSRFDHIYTFFGGMNDVTTGESYFLNIIGRYANIISQVTPNSLVILDELHGTDNFELAAIQVAVLHYLRALNCTVIFNTHIRDGLKIADAKVGLDFWQTDVEYDAQNNKVKPLYTLSPDPNLEAKSDGLAIASQWLTSEQINRVKEILFQLEEDVSIGTPFRDNTGEGLDGTGRRQRGLDGNGIDFVLGRQMREQYYWPRPEGDFVTGRRMRGFAKGGGRGAKDYSRRKGTDDEYGGKDIIQIGQQNAPDQTVDLQKLRNRFPADPAAILGNNGIGLDLRLSLLAEHLRELGYPDPKVPLRPQAIGFRMLVPEEVWVRLRGSPFVASFLDAVDAIMRGTRQAPQAQTREEIVEVRAQEAKDEPVVQPVSEVATTERVVEEPPVEEEVGKEAEPIAQEDNAEALETEDPLILVIAALTLAAADPDNIGIKEKLEEVRDSAQQGNLSNAINILVGLIKSSSTEPLRALKTQLEGARKKLRDDLPAWKTEANGHLANNEFDLARGVLSRIIGISPVEEEALQMQKDIPRLEEQYERQADEALKLALRAERQKAAEQARLAREQGARMAAEAVKLAEASGQEGQAAALDQRIQTALGLVLAGTEIDPQDRDLLAGAVTIRGKEAQLADRPLREFLGESFLPALGVIFSYVTLNDTRAARQAIARELTQVVNRDPSALRAIMIAGRENIEVLVALVQQGRQEFQNLLDDEVSDDDFESILLGVMLWLWEKTPDLFDNYLRKRRAYLIRAVNDPQKRKGIFERLRGVQAQGILKQLIEIISESGVYTQDGRSLFGVFEINWEPLRRRIFYQCLVDNPDILWQAARISGLEQQKMLAQVLTELIGMPVDRHNFIDGSAMDYDVLDHALWDNFLPRIFAQLDENGRLSPEYDSINSFLHQLMHYSNNFEFNLLGQQIPKQFYLFSPVGPKAVARNNFLRNLIPLVAGEVRDKNARRNLRRERSFIAISLRNLYVSLANQHRYAGFEEEDLMQRLGSLNANVRRGAQYQLTQVWYRQLEEGAISPEAIFERIETAQGKAKDHLLAAAVDLAALALLFSHPLQQAFAQRAQRIFTEEGIAENELIKEGVFLRQLYNKSYLVGGDRLLTLFQGNPAVLRFLQGDKTLIDIVGKEKLLPVLGILDEDVPYFVTEHSAVWPTRQLWQNSFIEQEINKVLFRGGDDDEALFRRLMEPGITVQEAEELAELFMGLSDYYAQADQSNQLKKVEDNFVRLILNIFNATKDNYPSQFPDGYEGAATFTRQCFFNNIRIINYVSRILAVVAGQFTPFKNMAAVSAFQILDGLMPLDAQDSFTGIRRDLHQAVERLRQRKMAYDSLMGLSEDELMLKIQEDNPKIQCASRDRLANLWEERLNADGPYLDNILQRVRYVASLQAKMYLYEALAYLASYSIGKRKKIVHFLVREYLENPQDRIMRDSLKIIYQRARKSEPEPGEEPQMTKAGLDEIFRQEHAESGRPKKEAKQFSDMLEEKIGWDPDGLVIEIESPIDKMNRLLKSLVVGGMVDQQRLMMALEGMLYEDTALRWGYLFGGLGIVSLAYNGVFAIEDEFGRIRQFRVAKDRQVEAFWIIVQGFKTALNNESITRDAELVNLYQKALDHLYWESQGILNEEEREEILEAIK